ncbi:hypothetical protein V8C86DRAFT_587021 [Haematococcus lacustris]
MPLHLLQLLPHLQLVSLVLMHLVPLMLGCRAPCFILDDGLSVGKSAPSSNLPRPDHFRACGLHVALPALLCHTPTSLAAAALHHHPVAPLECVGDSKGGREAATVTGTRAAVGSRDRPSNCMTYCALLAGCWEAVPTNMDTAAQAERLDSVCTCQMPKSAHMLILGLWTGCRVVFDIVLQGVERCVAFC